MDEPAPHVFLGLIDELLANSFADTMRARVQHDLDALLGADDFVLIRSHV